MCSRLETTTRSSRGPSTCLWSAGNWTRATPSTTSQPSSLSMTSYWCSRTVPHSTTYVCHEVIGIWSLNQFNLISRVIELFLHIQPVAISSTCSRKLDQFPTLISLCRNLIYMFNLRWYYTLDLTAAAALLSSGLVPKLTRNIRFP